MATIGYARVSTLEQDLTVQLDRLLLANCDVIYQEKMSGEKDARPELRRCLDAIQSGDVLTITRVDRLARSISHLYRILGHLQDRGASLNVLEQGGVDVRTPEGRMVFGMLGVFAEFETAIRRERQREGLAKARRLGVHLGRKDALSPAQVYDLRRRRAQGQTIRQLMYHFGIKKTTVYRYLGKIMADEVLDAAD
jgi:DNA invertase Pin-like site-specific DNA recombinase